jgi:hypothetical protein
MSLRGWSHGLVYLLITSDHIVLDDGDVANSFNNVLNTMYSQNMMEVKGVGIKCVRILQRWFRLVWTLGLYAPESRAGLAARNHRATRACPPGYRGPEGAEAGLADSAAATQRTF